MILLGNRRGKNRGGARIDGVAALFEHAVAGFHFHAVPGPDHLMHAANGREHGAFLSSLDSTMLRNTILGNTREGHQAQGPDQYPCSRHRTILSLSFNL